MRLLAGVLALSMLAGCLASDGDGCVEPAMLHTPWVEGVYAQTDVEQPWDTVVLRVGDGSGTPTVEPAGQVDEAAFGDGHFTRLRVEPTPSASQLELAYVLDDCDGRRAGTLKWPLMDPKEGRAAMPGQGVHVMTAGFWENGTLFYTNIEELDDSSWPRAAWYAWDGATPLPVYVYDEDRAEQPAAWKDPFGATPLAGATGLGYFTTIPGFNEALKGLSTTTTRVVRLSPEEAYTRDGNEEHPLYGDALVFYIKALRVVDLPCPPAMGGVCSMPGLLSNGRDG
jgi:hypothetical protein